MYSFWLDETASPAKRYYEGRAFVYGEGDDKVQYTKAGATPATFASLGFKEVFVDPRPWDDKYYIVSGPDNDGHYNATPRDLAELKTAFIQEQKNTARSILSNTDWYVIRALELTALGTPTAIPAATGTFRGEVRAAADARELLIDGCSTIEELEALMKAPAEIYDEASDSMIENPEAYLPVFPSEGE